MAEALLRQDSRGTGQSSAQVRELEVLARELVVEANDQLGVGVEGSMLEEAGREGVVEAAASDGSSFVCAKCGGLVAMRRKEAHDLYWCINPPPEEEVHD